MLQMSYFIATREFKLKKRNKTHREGKNCNVAEHVLCLKLTNQINPAR